MPESNDLSNKEKTLLMYFKEQAKQEFPDLDVSDHGAFMEMFGIPHIKLLSPLMEMTDRMKLQQSLDNASLMTEEEMDEVAGRYFETRRNGDYARGEVIFVFDDIPSSGAIQIPTGFELESTQNYLFRTLFSVSLNEESLINYYDPDTFEYRIPISVEADNPGRRYNISEGEIERPAQPISNLIRVYNDAAFLRGTDAESNEDLAQRIRETANVPNFGIERGWRAFAQSFEEVQDVIVAGYRHPLMQRDIIGESPEGRFAEAIDTNVHWGGKIDLHIRGKRLAERVQTSLIKKNSSGELYVDLESVPVHDVPVVTFSSPRYDENEYNEGFFAVHDYVLRKKEDPETIRTLHEESWVILLDDRLQENETVTVRYRYNELFSEIEEELYVEDGRPPASDILLKETVPKYIHLNVSLKMVSVLGLRESDRESIRSRARFWISQRGLGDEFQLSDLQIPIQFESGIGESDVDYINMPIQMLVTDYDENLIYYAVDESKRNFIQSVAVDYPYFHDLILQFKETVTMTDLFDYLHLVTHDKIGNTDLETVASQSVEISDIVDQTKIMRNMFLQIEPLRLLSPATRNFRENEHIETGEVVIFDDQRYAPSDLQALIELVASISSPGDDPIDPLNLLHLTVYLYTLIYLMTMSEGADYNDFISKIETLTTGTFVYDDIFNPQA